MSGKELFEVMNDIDPEYIEEAREISKKIRPVKYLKVAGFIAFVLALSFVIIVSKSEKKDYQVIAAELGVEELNMGATVPEIIYADEDRVIMYDWVGIWVYDLKNKKFAGYCDFRPIDMTQTQGNPCVFVEASSDGKTVRFYMNDGTVKYIYNVEKDEYKKVDDYKDNSNINYYLDYRVTENKSLSPFCDTYRMVGKDNIYISYTFSNLDNENPYEIYGTKYRDIILLIEKDGKIEEYKIFE